MKCPNCSRLMQELFITSVCDFCDPPKGYPRPREYETKTTLPEVASAAQTEHQWVPYSGEKRPCDVHGKDDAAGTYPAGWRRVGGDHDYLWGNGKIYSIEFVCAYCHKRLHDWLYHEKLR